MREFSCITSDGERECPKCGVTACGHSPEEMYLFALDALAEVDEMFNKEIVRELLTEDGKEPSQELVNEIWSRCGGNPWNAPIIKELLKL